MKKIYDPDMPVGKIRVVKDFLPKPDVLFSQENKEAKIPAYSAKHILDWIVYGQGSKIWNQASVLREKPKQKYGVSKHGTSSVHRRRKR